MVDPNEGLGAREREVLEILYRLEVASPAEVRSRIRDRLSDSTVRTMLRHLQKKKLVNRRLRDGRWVYYPARPAEEVRGSAVAHVLETFFSGSPAALVSTLLKGPGRTWTDAELERLERIVDEARREKE